MWDLVVARLAQMLRLTDFSIYEFECKKKKSRFDYIGFWIHGPWLNNYFVKCNYTVPRTNYIMTLQYQIFRIDNEVTKKHAVLELLLSTLMKIIR